VAGEAASEAKGGASGDRKRLRRRRPPSRAEQERREAWGREWGKVGTDYKTKRLERER